MKEKEEGDKLDTSDKADSTLLPGVLIAEVPLFTGLSILFLATLVALHFTPVSD